VDSSTFLVIASDYAIAQSLADAGRNEGWQVVLATASDFALPVAERSRPNAIVIDSQLKGGGLEAIREIQASVQTADIPIYAIADAEGSNIGALMAAGVQECFAPAVDAGTVIGAIAGNFPKRNKVLLAPGAITGNLERLRALAETQLLDSPVSSEFDELTALAAKLIDVPVVLVSLVDKDRQFFKSQFGLGEPWASKRETPLSHSFCQWVISEEKELLVFDAREHPVLKDNLAVRDLGVRAYAGVPLIGSPDKSIGSFCAIDSQPHQWTELQVANIEDLAHIANAYIVLQQSRCSNEDGELIEVTPAMRMEAASAAVNSAMRIINRTNELLGEKERQQILAIVKNKSEELVNFTGKHAAA